MSWYVCICTVVTQTICRAESWFTPQSAQFTCHQGMATTGFFRTSSELLRVNLRLFVHASYVETRIVVRCHELSTARGCRDTSSYAPHFPEQSSRACSYLWTATRRTSGLTSKPSYLSYPPRKGGVFASQINPSLDQGRLLADLPAQCDT